MTRQRSTSHRFRLVTADRDERSDEAPGRTDVGDLVPDERLVERARTGDRWAREVIFRRHVVSVTRVTARLLGPDPDVDDVVQDTFVAALRDLGRLRDPRALRSWLIGIAVNLVHKRIRRRRMRKMLGFRSGAMDQALSAQAAEGISPEQFTELRLLDRALASLPTEERTAWILRRVESENLADVAQATGCSLATAKRRIAAADTKLQSLMRRMP